MARYGTIFAGPVEKTQPASIERETDAALAPGTLVTIDGDQEFIAHANQGVRGSFFILSENTLEQQDTDTDVAAGVSGIGYYPDQDCFFYVLTEQSTACVAEVTQLTSNGSGVLEVAGAGDAVLFIAAETYTVSGSENELVLVRPYIGGIPAATVAVDEGGSASVNIPDGNS